MSRVLTWSVAVASILVVPLRGATPTVDDLARDVERAESVRAVKTLQRTYAQYSQYGLWNEMAALFSDDGRLTLGDDAATGRSAIATFLVTRGGGRQGLAPGAIHTQLIDVAGMGVLGIPVRMIRTRSSSVIGRRKRPRPRSMPGITSPSGP